MTDDGDGIGPWFGGSKVTADLPGTDATVTGRVRRSTGFGRTRIIVAGDDGEKDTEILLPTERITAVVDEGDP